MKKSSLFFLVLLTGLLCFSSCQKPEGDDPNDILSGADTVNMFNCVVKPNVDFMDVAIAVNPKKVPVAIDSMAFCYWLLSDSIKNKCYFVEGDTIIADKRWEVKDRIMGLQPDATYAYYFYIKDFFGTHNSDTIVVNTKKTNGGNARVTADSIRLIKDDNKDELQFYGSVRTHFRALDPSNLELKFRYGLEKNSLDIILDNYTIDSLSEAINDTVTCVYHCSMAGMIDSCYYQAFVKDYWNNNLVARDTLFFSYSRVIIENKTGQTKNK